MPLPGLLLLLALAFAPPSLADGNLPYPDGPFSADQIVAQVYAAAHGGLVRNAVSRANGRSVALVVNRAPAAMRKPGRRPTVQSFETFVNNAPQDPALESMQMAILTSGKARGTGVLLTNYANDARKSVISMWLPALRKIRRINEPAHDDVWFGTNLTYGELVLRRPEHEVHELLGEGEFPDCLATMRLERWELDRYTRHLPEPQCGHQGRPVYRIKSTTKFANWWYDYHVSDVDRESFAIYRTVYFKDGEKIKTVDVDWQSLERDDPREIYPRYIFAMSHDDGKESMVFVPRDTIVLDQDIPDAFWSEKTLKTYRPGGH